MKIAALLPHVEIYGGVRRYIEIGNNLVRRGHDFVLFHASGEKPSWLEFLGECRPFSSIPGNEFDVGLCSEYSILPQFDRLAARIKFFYFVLEGHKQEKGVIQKGWLFLGNSEGICRRIERKYGVRCIRAPGGVNPKIFHPLDREIPSKTSLDLSSETASIPATSEFRILCYGRIHKRRKGVRHVIRAVERLYRRHPGLRLIFFDSLVGPDKVDPRPLIKTRVPFDFHMNLPQNRMAWLFSQADLFVSAEHRAGWSNTSAEAMACGLPVVCTSSGTRDFAVPGETALVVPFPSAFLLSRAVDRLIRDPGLRNRLARAGCEKIKEFTWETLGARLEAIFRENLKGNPD